MANKKQLSIRIRKDMYDLLKLESKDQVRTLNSLIEYALHRTYHIPNEVTIAAMRESEKGENLLDVDQVLEDVFS